MLTRGGERWSTTAEREQVMIFYDRLPSHKFFQPMIQAYAKNLIESDEVDLGTVDLIEVRMAELKRQDEQIAEEAALLAPRSADA